MCYNCGACVGLLCACRVVNVLYTCLKCSGCCMFIVVVRKCGCGCLGVVCCFVVGYAGVVEVVVCWCCWVDEVDDVYAGVSYVSRFYLNLCVRVCCMCDVCVVYVCMCECVV